MTTVSFRTRRGKLESAEENALSEKSVHICQCKLDKHTEKQTPVLGITQVGKYTCEAFICGVSIVHTKYFSEKALFDQDK